MPKQEIWLVRHGETEWSRTGQHTGRMNIPLTPLGEAQALALKAELAGHTFAAVLVSPLRRAERTCELTSNTADLQRALGGVKAQGWTALFDGIMMGAQKMRRAGNSRRALVILSDGDDNFSRYQESEVKAYLREAGVVVFAITLTGSAPPTHQTHHLRGLARETGGWAYSIGNLEKMTEAVRAIGVAIRSQYTLTYAPTNGKSDGKLHRIAVQLAPKDPGVAASWRSSYYAVDLR